MTLALRRDMTPQERKEEERLFEEQKSKRQQSEQNTEKSEAGPAHPATVFPRDIKNAFLLQHQKLPTRYRVGQIVNILDLVFTYRVNMINDVTTTAGVRKSDHFSLIINVNCDYDVAPQQARYNYKKTDFTVLNQELEIFNRLVTELKELSVNDFWLCIKDICVEQLRNRRLKHQHRGAEGRVGWTLAHWHRSAKSTSCLEDGFRLVPMSTTKPL
ncbi:hypothetical protein HAZT_HAZT011348 [Hyalella azteca]|uniref:Uncharacterized protein n=1 Tax=Hyalella azteca TaxID=294128 RepID=A0A6A0H3Q2_HYAAZ|nr:hypothetical protein HAZT_HAZT011348 [Hyalella azteca]